MSAASTASTTSPSTTAKLKTLENLPFDNLAIRSLPVDEERQIYIRPVSNACYSYVQPEPVKNPMLVAVSADVSRSSSRRRRKKEEEELVIPAQQILSYLLNHTCLILGVAWSAPLRMLLPL